MKSKSIVIGEILNVFLVSMIFLLIILAIPRGFDFTDEGLYLLLADPFQENFKAVFNYDLIFKLIFKLFDIEFGIFGLRILRIISVLIGGYFLLKFWEKATGSRKEKGKIYLLAVLGLTCSYGFLPQSLSYNHLSLLLACIWIYAFSSNTLGSKSIVLIGLSLGLFFYVKITTCLILALASIARILYDIVKKQIKLDSLLLLILPFLILEIVFYFTLETNGVLRVNETLSYQIEREGYLWQNLMKYTMVGIFWLGLASIPFFLMGFFGFYRGTKNAQITLGVIFLIIICFYTTMAAEYSHFFVFGLVAVLAYYIGKQFRLGMNKKEFFLISSMCMIPFALHFGSNLYFMRIAIHFIVFWGFAFLLLRFYQNGKVDVFAPLITSLSTLSIILIGLWIFPSHYTPLYKVNKVWEVKDSFIKVSSEKHLLLNYLKEKLEVSNSSNVLFVYSNPGLAYLLGYNLPKTPLIWNQKDLEIHFPDNTFDLVVSNSFDSLPSSYSLNRKIDSLKTEDLKYYLLIE